MTDDTPTPPGWLLTTLGDVFRWGSGGTPRSDMAAFYGGDIPWVVIGDLNDGLVTATASRLTLQGVAQSAAKWVEPGSVLVAMYGSIGKLGIAGMSLTTNQAIAFTNPRPVEPKYLFWYLFWRRNELSSHGKGGTQQNISQTVLKSFPFLLAPLAEQHRIVAAIEEHLSRLDAAVAGLERVRDQLPGYWAAVLSSMLETAIAATQTRQSTIGAELREPLRNGHSAKESRNGSGVRTLTLTAVTQGDFSMGNTKLTVADPGKVVDLWLEPGDLLIERSNTPELVGTARMYAGSRGFAIFPDLLIRARMNDHLLPRFVEAVLNAPKSRRYFRAAAQGIAGTMPKISQGTIETMAIPVPPLVKQQELLDEVERRVAVCQAVDLAVAGSLRRATRLRQSILRRAFSGQLVPQDPSDEPASALLERIRAERAAVPIRPRSKRSRKATR